MTHELKVWPQFYDAIIRKDKTFEVRRHDRDFAVGDELILREWDRVEERRTGRVTIRNITYIMQGGALGIESGFCVLGIV